MKASKYHSAWHKPGRILKTKKNEISFGTFQPIPDIVASGITTKDHIAYSRSMGLGLNSVKRNRRKRKH